MGYSGGLDAFKANRQNRQMAKHVSNRNFRRKRSSIKSKGHRVHDIPEEKQFGSNSLQYRDGKRKTERIVVGIVLALAVCTVLYFTIAGAI